MWSFVPPRATTDVGADLDQFPDLIRLLQFSSVDSIEHLARLLIQLGVAEDFGAFEYHLLARHPILDMPTYGHACKALSLFVYDAAHLPERQGERDT